MKSVTSFNSYDPGGIQLTMSPMWKRLFFSSIFEIELYILKSIRAHSYRPFNSIGGKKFVYIMELFSFKYNASYLDILKSLDKLWDCKYLTKLYNEITP